MKKRLEYYLQISIAPVYFILLVIFGITEAVIEAYRETSRAYYATRRIYKRNSNVL